MSQREKKNVSPVAPTNRDCVGRVSRGPSPPLWPRGGGECPCRGVAPHARHAGSGPRSSAWAKVGVQPHPGDPWWGGPCGSRRKGSPPFSNPHEGARLRPAPVCASVPHTRVPVVVAAGGCREEPAVASATRFCRHDPSHLCTASAPAPQPELPGAAPNAHLPLDPGGSPLKRQPQIKAPTSVNPNYMISSAKE